MERAKREETVRVSFKTDAAIKEKAAETYGKLGIDMTTAYNAFLRMSIICGGFPFDVRLNTPNKDTLAAIAETDAILSGELETKTYGSAAELFEDLAI